MALILLLLLAPLLWEEQGAKLRFLNSEATRDKAYVLVHLELTPQMDLAAFRWEGLAQVINRQAESLPIAGDCGVDMLRTSGHFPLKKGKKQRLLLYFYATPGDFPLEVHLQGQVVQRHK